MANDHHYYHGSSNSSNISSKHRKKVRITNLPPVPSAHPRLLQSAQRRNPAVSAVDPEAMPAKQGLNEWGAFSSGSTSSESGTFGLGPLLFRHAGADESETMGSAPSAPLTGRDLVEMDRLLRNDPVSFNPMQAISWARLDEDVAEALPPPLQQQQEREPKGEENGKSRSARESGDGLEYQQGGRGSASGASVKRSVRQSGQIEYAAYNTSTTPIGAAMSTPSAKAVYRRDSEKTEPAPSPVGNMAQTFSDMDMEGSHTNGVFVPPAAAVLSPNTTHRAGSAQPQVRQKRKHRHRHEKKTTGSSPTDDVHAQQQPGHRPSTFPTSSTPVSIPTQHPHPAQYQVAYTNYPTVSPSHHPFPPPAAPPPQQQQQVIGLLLCLAPSCQARFSSEAQLNAHYQAVHAASEPSHGGRQHLYPSFSSLACSWTLCGAGGFTSNNALVWHVKAEHLLLCPVPGCCDRVFPSRKQLDGHIRHRVG